MADYEIDDAALASLASPDAECDQYLHHLAVQAYVISQQKVPQPGASKGYATGALKASGVVERDGEDWLVVYHRDYSVYVEMGTRYMAPQPYLRPSLLAVVHE